MRRAVPLLLSCVLVLAGGWAGPASAAPVEGCAATFCLTHELTPATTTAGAPVGLDLSMTNTSPDHLGVKPLWWGAVYVDLMSARVTPSSDLPDTLLVASSPSGCDASSQFTGCAAGHGQAVEELTGSTLPGVNGTRSAPYGILKISNVHGGPPGAVAEYAVALRLCVALPFPDPCQMTTDLTLPVFVAAPASGSTSPQLQMLVQIAPMLITSLGGATLDASLDSLALHLDGTSSTLADGTPADRSYDLFELPTSCGPVSATGAAVSRASQTATVAQTVAVGGCPTATLAATADGTTVQLQAVPTTAGGRAVASYVWHFGDGTTQTTSTGSVRHTYPDASPRSVTVDLVDAAGARGTSAPLELRGSSLSLTAKAKVRKGHKVKLKGVLTAAAPGARQVTVERCTIKGLSCRPIGTATTAGNGAFVLATKVKKAALYRATFAGAEATFGSEATRLVKLRRH